MRRRVATLAAAAFLLAPLVPAANVSAASPTYYVEIFRITRLSDYVRILDEPAAADR
jgi:adenosylmethionine-8-amino-7-oxononanoate aminotransferase